MSDSLREKFLTELVRRLQQIDVKNGFQTTVASVQRQKHTWNQDRHETNQISDRPAIIIFNDFENVDPGDMKSWRHELRVELHYYTDPQEGSDDETVTAALADMQQAIFTDVNGNADNRFGVPTGNVRWDNRTFDRESNQSEDGIILGLVIEYQTKINNPYEGL